MELAGFGTSLVGRSIYIHCSNDEKWLPWEFVNASYTGRILITGPDGCRSDFAITNDWNVIFSPKNTKDWSVIATVLKGLGNTLLLVYDYGFPVPPTSYQSYVESLLSDSRTVITRIYYGNEGVNGIPDVVLFPPNSKDVYDICARLPATRNHGVWSGVSLQDYEVLYLTVKQNKLAFLITDIGERSWTLFWHRIEDSQVNNTETKKFLPTLLMCAYKLASLE